MTVVVLEDAGADLDAGRRLYESREAGVGDYFLESLLSDLDSLVLYAGIHSRHFGFHRLLSKRFPFGNYYEVEGGTAYVYAIFGHATGSPFAPVDVAEQKIASQPVEPQTNGTSSAAGSDG